MANSNVQSNSNVQFWTTLSNQTVAANSSAAWYIPGISPDNFYSVSVIAETTGVLNITTGWGNWGTPATSGYLYTITNTSSAPVTYDVLLMQVSAGSTTQLTEKDVKSVKAKQ